MPPVSPATFAVIPCRNEARSIARLLDALAAQTLRPDTIIAVDDGSTDGTADVVRAWAREHRDIPTSVVAAGGRGAGAAMNAGIAAAPEGIIVRLDGHCRPEAAYIEQSVRTLQAADAGVAGGIWKIEPGAGTLVARGIAAVLSHPLGSGGAEYRTLPDAARAAGPREVDTVPFGAFRKDVWTEVGGFDESLLRNQDYDFNHRVRLTGRKVLLNPAIVSAYQARPTLAALWRQYFGYGFWKIVMLRKFPSSIRVRQAVPLLLVPGLLALAIWTLATAGAVPIAIIGIYLALDAAGAAQAAARAGELRLMPFAAAALITLQIAWSAGAWISLLKPGRGARAGSR